MSLLSKQPPPQKAPPSIPLPPPPSAYSSIAAWASLVQPGSPPPRSPPSRRSSFSISHAGQHTTVFLHLDLPKSPTSPYLRQRSTTVVEFSKPLTPKSTAYSHIPMPPIPSQEPPPKRTGLSRLRSFSILRSRSSKPKQQPSIPPSPHYSVATSAPKSKPTKSKKHSAPTTESCPSTIAKRKRAKYLIPPPPSLANDLALMQFMDGGNIDSHAKSVMEAQAKAAAGSGAQHGVADVYRDGNGGIWWDADEEWEYTHLLADTGSATPTPISKANNAMAIDWDDTQPCYFTNLLANKENDPLDRRDSVSSLDSDLDPKYLVTVPELTLTGFNAPVEDRVLASHKVGDPGMGSFLSLPSRPRRKALHLNKAEFLVDLAAFGPRSPTTTKSSLTTSSHTKPNPKGQARRRPAPLKLAHQSQNAVVVVRRPGQLKTAATTLESVVEKGRKEFIADSFAPVPATTKTNTTTNIVRSNPAPPPPPLGIMNKKPSRMNMRGLFGRKAN